MKFMITWTIAPAQQTNLQRDLFKPGLCRLLESKCWDAGMARPWDSSWRREMT